jgi:hypothetical protein
MNGGARRFACGVALGLAMTSGGAVITPQVNAQECHYAYGGCLPYVDDFNCEDIGWAVVEVWDVNDDPYGLDVLYGPGNGYTCDGIG